jgi:hypothetical protein
VREEGDKIVQEFRQTFEHVILASAGHLTPDEIKKAFLEALKSSSWAKWYVFDHLSPPQKKSFKYMIGEDLN